MRLDRAPQSPYTAHIAHSPIPLTLFTFFYYNYDLLSIHLMRKRRGPTCVIANKHLPKRFNINNLIKSIKNKNKVHPTTYLPINPKHRRHLKCILPFSWLFNVLAISTQPRVRITESNALRASTVSACTCLFPAYPRRSRWDVKAPPPKSNCEAITADIYWGTFL